MRFSFRIRTNQPAREYSIDACNFRAYIPTVSKIDLVDDLRDGLQRRIVEPEGPYHALERAKVPPVPKLRFGHVESHFVRLRGV